MTPQERDAYEVARRDSMMFSRLDMTFEFLFEAGIAFEREKNRAEIARLTALVDAGKARDAYAAEKIREGLMR